MRAAEAVRRTGNALWWTLLVKGGFLLGCGLASSARHLLA
jgi:hypothetical protein